jgi:hypothetical protein
MRLSGLPACTIEFPSNARHAPLPFQYLTCDGVSSVTTAGSPLPTIGHRHSESYNYGWSWWAYTRETLRVLSKAESEGTEAPMFP